MTKGKKKGASPRRSSEGRQGMKINTFNSICRNCGQIRKLADGKHLKELRRDAGFSLRELGLKIGLSAPYLSDIEFNRRKAPKVLITFWSGKKGQAIDAAITQSKKDN